MPCLSPEGRLLLGKGCQEVTYRAKARQRHVCAHEREERRDDEYPTASILPNLLIPPSALVEEKRTKYPTTTQKVAGIKLMKKHIAASSTQLFSYTIPDNMPPVKGYMQNRSKILLSSPYQSAPGAYT